MIAQGGVAGLEPDLSPRDDDRYSTLIRGRLVSVVWWRQGRVRRVLCWKVPRWPRLRRENGRFRWSWPLVPVARHSPDWYPDWARPLAMRAWLGRTSN